MSEKKLKHLEFVQNVITRMASNSFFIKGWSVTLIAGVFALSAKDANEDFIIVAYIPIIVFWILDGFFLSQERQYRRLYQKVSETDENDIDFCMNASEWNKDSATWCCSLFSQTLLVFHGSLLAVVLLVMYGKSFL